MSAICLLALILLIWFKTNAFVEYMKAFSFSIIKEYEMVSANDGEMTFPEFLREYHNCFFTRLISCPICTSVWLGFPIAISMSNLLAYPIITFIGLALYLTIVKLL